MLNQHEAWGFPSGKQRNENLEGKTASLSQYSKRDLYAKQKKKKGQKPKRFCPRSRSLPEDGVAFHSAQIQSQEKEVLSLIPQKRNIPVSETARLVRKRNLKAQPTVISDITAG